MKIPVYIYAEKNAFSGKLFCRALSWKSEMFGTLAYETEVEFPEPPIADVINGQVKTLRSVQQQIRAKCEQEVESIERQIGELLAIEDKSEEAPE